jgi:hypothetical protein
VASHKSELGAADRRSYCEANVRIPALTCLLLLMTGPLMAQDPVAQMDDDQVTLVENDVLSLAEAMPADRYAFVPSGGDFAGVHNFGEQVKHLATMIFMTAAQVLEERSPYGPGTHNNGPDESQTKEDIVGYLKDSLAYARRAMATLTEENHLERVPSAFGMQTRVEIAAGVAYHSYNHYGQMVVYARMNGIVPTGDEDRVVR